jgi:predicted ATP-dependent serine protease
MKPHLWHNGKCVCLIIEHVDITMVSNCSDLFLNKHDDKSHGTGALAFLKARQPETRSLGTSSRKTMELKL